MREEVRRNTIYSKMALGEIVCVDDLVKEFRVPKEIILNDLLELSNYYDIINYENECFALRTLPKIFSEEEKETVKVLLSALGKKCFSFFDHLIDEILNVHDEWVDFDMDCEPIRDIESFKLILQMLRWDYTLSFVYKSRQREVHPIKIACLGGYWYLFGYDFEKKIIKSFLLNKIYNVLPLWENRLQDGDFSKKCRSSLKHLSPWVSNSKKSVILKIKNPLNDLIKRKVPLNAELIAHKEEFSIIRYYYFEDIEAFSFISRYIPHIEIEDDNLKSKVKKMLLEYANSL